MYRSRNKACRSSYQLPHLNLVANLDTRSGRSTKMLPH